MPDFPRRRFPRPWHVEDGPSVPTKDAISAASHMHLLRAFVLTGLGCESGDAPPLYLLGMCKDLMGELGNLVGNDLFARLDRQREKPRGTVSELGCIVHWHACYTASIAGRLVGFRR